MQNQHHWSRSFTKEQPEQNLLSMAEKCLTLCVCVCLQLPSFSSSAYGFALDVTSVSELLQEPLPRSLSSCIPFLPCALTKQAPCGKSITVKSWHFLTSIAGTSHQQELSPPPRLRPKHSGPQKRWGEPEWSCLTCRDTRRLRQSDLSHLATK